MSEAITRRQFVIGAAAAAGAAALYYRAPGLTRAMPRAWVPVPTTPSFNQVDFTILAAEGYLFALGGGKDVGGGLVERTNVIERAPILGPGRLGAWEIAGNFSRPLDKFVWDLAVAFRQGVVYVVAFDQPVLYAPLQGGSLGSWAETSPLPEDAQYARWPYAAMVGDFLFVAVTSVAAEYNYKTHLYRARIRADGSLAPWDSLGEVYPPGPAKGEAALVAYGDRLYLLGGFAGRGPYDNRVFIAPVDSSGEVGPWQLGPSLLVGLAQPGAAVLNRQIYVEGSVLLALLPPGGKAEWASERSAILPGGDLGPWVAGPDGAAYLGSPSMAVAPDGLYKAGGPKLFFLWDPPFETFFPFIGQGTQAW